MNCFVDIEEEIDLYEGATTKAVNNMDQLDKIELKPEKSSKRVNKKGQGLRYHWTKVEQRRYISFLVKNYEAFDKNTPKPVYQGVNYQMSLIVKSRDQTQCRTHHQKMMGKYNSVSGIISHHQSLLGQKCLKIWHQLFPENHESFWEEKQSAMYKLPWPLNDHQDQYSAEIMMPNKIEYFSENIDAFF